MKSQSKFDAILDRKKNTENSQQVSQSQSEGKEKRGRPTGKRTNPNYAQVTSYIPRSLYDEVKISLIKEGGKEFSTLVEELLYEWMQNRTGASPRGRKVAGE
jgi:hypothetical protein